VVWKQGTITNNKNESFNIGIGWDSRIIGKKTNPNLANTFVSQSLKSGLLSLTAVCEKVEELWGKLNKDSDKAPSTIRNEKEQTKLELRSFIQAKEAYFDDWRIFGPILKAISQKWGSIAFANRLIDKINS
jgi:hypothetical protein